MRKVVSLFFLFLCLKMTPSSAQINQGMVAYWPFNGNANDVTSNGNNGVINGALLTTDKWGNPNGAYEFNGLSDFIQVTNSSFLNFPNDSFSIYALVKPKGFYTGLCHGNCIVDKGSLDNTQGAYSLRFSDAPYLNFTNCSNPADTNHFNFYFDRIAITGLFSSYTPYVQNNVWYCVTSVHRPDSFFVYVNGIKKIAVNNSQSIGINSQDLFIGKKDNPTFPYWFKGTIDEIRIYNRTLNQVEIDSLCNYSPESDSVMNHYAAVQSYDSCKNIYNVDDASAFSAGDTVIIIQMKGAEIDTTNTAGFGTITNYLQAGNYEVNVIDAVTSNDMTMLFAPLNAYMIPAGRVQIVSYPSFQDYTVTNRLVADPWDGNKGGVIAFKVHNLLTLDNDIDASGMGFRGAQNVNPSSPLQLCGIADFKRGPGVDESALKGEGIAEVPNNMMYGRGKLANGGGAGNGHNGGGGGGGNGNVGGIGGYEFYGCNATPSFNYSGGLPGQQLNYSTLNNKLFLGGGGGAAQANNTWTDASGANGGGLIIMTAQNIFTNSGSILSKGLDAPTCSLGPGDCHDGMGGGGAGGSVIINSTGFNNYLVVDVSGGKGGDVSSVPSNNEVGPGGGGGGGVVWLQGPAFPANVGITNNGGANGMVLYNNSNWGAMPGSSGTNLLNYQIPIANIPYSYQPFLSAGNDTTICLGDFAQLNGSGAVSYFWTPVATLSNPNIANPLANPLTQTAYIVTGTNALGCSDADTVIVSVNPLPNVVANVFPDTICEGASTVFSGSGANVYTWSDGVINGNSFIPDISHTYTVTGTDLNGCSAMDTAHVEVIPPLPIVITPANPYLCKGDSVFLTASGADSYQWSPNFRLSNGWTDTTTSKPPYTVTYTVTGTDVHGCTGQGTVEVVVVSDPKLDFWKNRDAECGIHDIQMTVTGANSFLWSPAGLVSDSTASAVSTTINKTTTFYVTGQVGSCTVTDSFTVYYYNNSEDGIFVPNAFSPNKDGNNDCFRIFSQANISEYEMHIYNRWGNPVWESTDINECWDGTYKGLDLPQAVYYYYMKANTKCGEIFLKGDVLIMH